MTSPDPDASPPAEPEDLIDLSRRLREQARAARSSLREVRAEVRRLREVVARGDSELCDANAVRRDP